jgi:hypothetical protein
LLKKYRVYFSRKAVRKVNFELLSALLACCFAYCFCENCKCESTEQQETGAIEGILCGEVKAKKVENGRGIDRSCNSAY